MGFWSLLAFRLAGLEFPGIFGVLFGLRRLLGFRRLGLHPKLSTLSPKPLNPKP